MGTKVGSGSLTIVDVNDGLPGMYLSLSSPVWVATCANDGTVLSYIGAVSAATVMEGSSASSGWVYNTPTTSDTAKVQGLWDTSTRTFTLQSFDKSLDSAWVEFTATKNGITLTSRMNLSKSKVGAIGYIYALEEIGRAHV